MMTGKYHAKLVTMAAGTVTQMYTKSLESRGLANSGTQSSLLRLLKISDWNPSSMRGSYL